MIDPISSSIAAQTLINPSGVGPVRANPLRDPAGVGAPGEAASAMAGSFADLVGNLVSQVDAKGKVSETEARRLMLGETDNIHRSMMAMQESGVAFSLLVEVRNKLVESYQELMRMPV